MTALKLKAPLPTEDEECQNLIRWARLARFERWRIADLLIMIPNGAYLGGDVRQRAITMAKMKRCGFKNGAFDYILPVARGNHHGLWLEMKRRELSVVSPDQILFQADMRALGWACAIAKGWEEGKDAINQYLGVL